MNLPEPNGMDLCSAHEASGRGLPTVLITGRNHTATRRLIQEAHPVAALFKRVDERTLCEAITRALSQNDSV